MLGQVLDPERRFRPHRRTLIGAEDATEQLEGKVARVLWTRGVLRHQFPLSTDLIRISVNFLRN